NAPTGLMKKLGYSKGYLYPHNYPGGWIEQDYFPEAIRNRVFYRPTPRGFEKEIKRRLAEIEQRLKQGDGEKKNEGADK
ncbi:MAG: replication-associated recombination protein A, partial [Desulfobacteraceae bacterium]